MITKEYKDYLYPRLRFNSKEEAIKDAQKRSKKYVYEVTAPWGKFYFTWDTASYALPVVYQQW